MNPFNINYAQLYQLSRSILNNELLIKKLQTNVKTLTDRITMIETSKRVNQCKNG